MKSGIQQEPAEKGGSPAVEYVAAGALVSLFSIFLGFYAAAITFASRSYPELNVELIEAIHRAIIRNLTLTVCVAVPLAAGLFYLLARRHAARGVR